MRGINDATATNRCENNTARGRGAGGIVDMFDQRPEAREAFVEAAWLAIRETRKRLNRRREDAESQLRSLEQGAENLVAAIEKGGKLAKLLDPLGKKEKQIAELRGTLLDDAEEDLFLTKEDVISRLSEALHELVRKAADHG
ncbi:MAG: hypothetical protein H8E44_26180 [Planctomycetes bacterium]|nr:hypothetical protein [Planctomycetota bacterium]MBL7044250.1 hypothetical protein [Pirellulaceae bacterium]